MQACAASAALAPSTGYTQSVVVEPSISGISIIHSRQSLEELASKDVVERALLQLSEADRAAYLAVAPSSWLPVRIADEVQRAVALEAGVGVEEFAEFIRAFSHRGVARMVGTVWKLLLQFTSDRALVERTPELHAQTYNIGRLSAVVESPGHGVVTLEEWPAVSDEQMIGIAAGIEAVLQEAGRKGVAVRWKRTGEGAQYTLGWTP